LARADPHSYADLAQPRTRHVRFSWNVDFEARRIDGTATLEFEGPGSGPVDLDTKDLLIESVVDGAGRPVSWDLEAEEPILGRRLRLELPPGTTSVTVAYSTSPLGIGLQWLTPAQTEGKRLPCLFSQCQPIHARTVAPLQDSPRFRVTYEAEVTVPETLAAVMSAAPLATRPGPRAGTRTFGFRMPQAIPSYLIALAVGDLQSRDLSPRSRVWAEPTTVDAAAREFDGVEAMITTAETIFGPYDWDRYDMLVLPPAFPYGGMENPRMTFLTPTLIAGDRSLVDVVAHELAHSWTGNLVSNADMDHFWLNEGFTTWAERRILEALHGPEAVTLEWAIGEKGLEQALDQFGRDSAVTRLRTDFSGVDPDDAFSRIPYEKGARFLTLIERTVGRARFDAFVREYMDRFRFTSITSEDFLAFLEQRLPGAAEAVNAKSWVYEAGIPKNAPSFRSEKLEALTALAEGWSAGTRPSPQQVSSWTPSETLVYLQRVPRELPSADCAWLDEAMSLSGRGNYEILVEWLTIAAGSDYEPAFPRLREVLTRVGRMKYLRPLYLALGRHPRTRALAREVFAVAAESYHALSRRVAQSVIEKYPEG
jgi:leukotriene-A4 hydrolase